MSVFKTAGTVLELIRWANCAMAGFGALVGMMIAFMALPDSMQVQFLYEPPVVFLAVFLITGAGNAINDYFDYRIDWINRPSRPIPSGRISRYAVLYISTSLFFAGIVMSYWLGPVCLFLAVFNSFLLFVYARTLKSVALLGNMVVSYLTGSTFLFGGAVAVFGTAGIQSTVILFILACLVTLAREIVKDIEDMEGDMREGAGTLPIRIGKDRASKIAGVVAISGVVLSPFPFFFMNFGIAYLAVIFAADLMMLVSINEMLLRDRPKKASKLLKLAMFTALLAFVAGTIY